MKKYLIILVNQNYNIEKELTDAFNTRYFGIPKTLLHLGNTTPLDMILNHAKTSTNHISIITNTVNFKHIENWAFMRNFPLENLLVNGNSQNMNSFIDALDTVIRNNYNHLERTGSIHLISSDFVPCLQLDHKNDRRCLAIFRPCKINLAALIIPTIDVPKIAKYIETLYTSDKSGFVNDLDFVKQLDNILSKEVDTVFLDSKNSNWLQLGLKYEEYINEYCNNSDFLANDMNLYSAMKIGMSPKSKVNAKSYARVGFIGNPSDGFFGKTIAASIQNFSAEVYLIPNEKLNDFSISFATKTLEENHSFTSLECIARYCKKNGYYGSRRLFLAILKLFFEFCKNRNVETKFLQGFRIFYRTDIPRQVGLAGSSALVTALLKALIKYYEIPLILLPLHEQANMALAAEQNELGISAGYQDRVVQIYGGCVSMSFNQSLMESRGYGEYERINVNLLPKNMWLGNKKHSLMKSVRSQSERIRKSSQRH